MSMNKQRRQLLKTVSAMAASSAVLVTTPSIVSAACSSSQTAASTALPGSGVRVSLSSVGTQTYVTVTNTLTTPVTLTKVYPGTVSDASGIFDLNSLLTSGPKTVMPGKPWVSKILPAQVTNLNSPVAPKATQSVKLTVATRNATPDGYKLVETTRFLLA